MSAEFNSISNPGTAAPHDGIVIVGGGPVGMRTAQVLARAGLASVVLTDETVDPYNRVQLTPLLAGEAQFRDIILPGPTRPEQAAQLCLGQHVVRIDRTTRKVVTAAGAIWPYRKLVLATGSRAFVPNIPGRHRDGVFRFRSADDASALLARSFSARRVAVIGGGLLGLEAARGMAQRGCAVTIVEHEGRLMPRQLDAAGGALLADRVADMGVVVRTGVAVKEITGTERVAGLALSDGTEIACDTVVICTGIRANLDLARDAGLAFGRGITVDDRMQTSDPDILAVGECAEHDGQLYGLVGPGLLQAEVAADRIAGHASRFDARPPATKLKVIGAEVFSAGPVEQLEARANVRTHAWQSGGAYRRIFIERGRLVAAIAVGGWRDVGRVQDAVGHGLTVQPWMVFRFRANGHLWPESDHSAEVMADGATVCNCTGVTAGQLRRAMSQGAATVPDLSAATGAGTVCGTCQPLMAEMIDAGGAPEPIPLWKPVLGLSSVAMLIGAVPLVVGAVPFPDSYAPDSLRDWLWRDNIVKQWTGFLLVGLTLAAFALGLRKRVRWLDRLGGFNGWRLVHNGIGLVALAGFLLHTGFALGSGWNLALGLTFLGAILIGALAGLATGGDHALRARQIGTARNPPRRVPTWAHILLLWPLPLLVLFHALASYAF
ncbi:FAD-dependent oxidoreductase [Jannaschia sp. M317]|uniref:FAD-dependent oxidoreductase n=1 Tax=Jannaschia sp. M317 TaxID=2867011 RepID=UPI0021A90DF7|nr:FAD-dependent oxidoreductase [Jannaschia sp. M317]UWQ16816.1 FAD-dependent oxidoreductase [Jannaschia sp. M317]